jgi:glutamate-1-semialdehyde 2,1-aminomutase
MSRKTERLFEEAKRLMPGGVSSPVRAFGGVGGTPVFLEEGHGAIVTDADGREYVDYLGSWGPLIVGHAHPRVVAAIRDQAGKGTTFGAPTELETELARRVVAAVPSCEKVRFVSSGTEATMSAIRLARAATGRCGIIKVEGCYHGHVDSLLVKAGSGVLTLGIPGSPGIPPDLASLTLTIPFNDVSALERVLAQHGKGTACFIVEPVAGNMGVVPPKAGWLQAARELTEKAGVLLILDEVMTGFRVAPGGAQSLYGVTPDLSCFGKVIGGGLPVGAYGGRSDLMDRIAPAGPVYQAGTLSGNPLAMRAGIETLDILGAPGTYERLEALSARLAAGLAASAEKAGVAAVVNRVGSMLTAFFTAGPVVDFATATRSDTKRYARFFHAMLARGVYLAPSQFEAAFVSTAHDEAFIDRTIAAAADAMREAASAA